MSKIFYDMRYKDFTSVSMQILILFSDYKNRHSRVNNRYNY